MSAENVAKRKYEQYLKKYTIGESPFGPAFSFTGEDDFRSDFSMFVISVNKAILMEEFAHSHDFDIYLIFLGFDPGGMGKLGAEIEMSFGEEGEKYIINSPTTVYIPKGLVHCPLEFKRVDKPVLFIHLHLPPDTRNKRLNNDISPFCIKVFAP
jgi:hypothetical protein